MSEHVVRALGDQMQALIRANEQTTVELRRVLGPLEKLPELIQMQAEAVERSVSAQTRAMAEMEVAALVADLSGTRTTAGGQSRLLERASGDLKEEVEEVGERYRRIQDELTETANLRVQELDAAALRLMEDDFQQVRAQYTSRLLQDAETLQEEALLMSGLRQRGLEESLSDAEDAVLAALNERKDLQAFLRRGDDLFVPGTGPEDTRYLPFVHATREDAQGHHGHHPAVLLEGDGRVAWQEWLDRQHLQRDGRLGKLKGASADTGAMAVAVLEATLGMIEAEFGKVAVQRRDDLVNLLVTNTSFNLVTLHPGA